MMEILINENDWSGNARRLSAIICKLKEAGWERFGHCGTIVLFKDISEKKARAELEDMRITDVKAEVWREELYDYSVF